MWMLENEDGAFMVFDEDGNPVFDASYQGFASADKGLIETYRRDEGGHLVEMVSAKAKVPVSQEEADVLEHAKSSTNYGPKILHDYVDQHGGHLLAKSDLEDRLMRAYVDGYKVVEPTKYNVKVPHTASQYYAKYSDTDELSTLDADSWFLTREYAQFTDDEIEHYGLQHCERVEINTEDSDGVD
jgi:hypothetical protein